MIRNRCTIKETCRFLQKQQKKQSMLINNLSNQRRRCSSKHRQVHNWQHPTIQPLQVRECRTGVKGLQHKERVDLQKFQNKSNYLPRKNKRLQNRKTMMRQNDLRQLLKICTLFKVRLKIQSFKRSQQSKMNDMMMPSK